MADSKITGLTEATTPTIADVMPIVQNVSTTPATRKVTVENLLALALPDQSGHDGEYLTTDGTDPSWAAVDALPDQSGHDGEYLTTNGSAASWTAVSVSPTRATFTNGDLSTGVLTVTHNLALSAPYSVIVKVFNNSAQEIIPDTVTGLTNSFTITLTSYGTLSGTWGYVYWAA